MIAVSVPAARDRQQQEEQRDARQRVEDAGDLRDRADEPAAPVGDQREDERDREADADRHDDQEHVLQERRRVAVDVVDDPVRAEAVVRDAAVACASRKNPLSDWARSAAAITRLARRRSPRASSRG